MAKPTFAMFIWGGMMPDDKFSDHIRDRFAAAKVQTDPFPYLVIEKVIPEALFASIERDIPHSWHWLYAAIAGTQKNLAANERAAGNRWMGALSAWRAAIKAAQPEAHPLSLAQPMLDCRNPSRATPGLKLESRKWRRKYLPAVSLINNLVEKAFQPHADKYMEQLLSLGFYNEPQGQDALVNEFCKRMRGWTIDPHTHDIGQAIQWMLYFPLPGSTEDQGTMFYRLIKPKTVAGEKLRGGSLWFDADEIEYCFTVPYRPNTLVAFLNTPYSVHGTVDIPNMVARRYFFICNWWNTAPAVTDVEVMPGNIIRSVADKLAPVA
jgi:hypothetical protein